MVPLLFSFLMMQDVGRYCAEPVMQVHWRDNTPTCFNTSAEDVYDRYISQSLQEFAVLRLHLILLNSAFPSTFVSTTSSTIKMCPPIKFRGSNILVTCLNNQIGLGTTNNFQNWINLIHQSLDWFGSRFLRFFQEASTKMCQLCSASHQWCFGV